MRLGVNIDHVATLRNARGGEHPCVMRAAQVVKQCGAELITIHLREDRRHIRDADASGLIAAQILPINLEMAATQEMLSFALQHKPYAACIVPEKREEVTTEGGLNAAAQQSELTALCAALKSAGIRTSLFIDADEVQVAAAAAIGADCVELHTGSYAHAAKPAAQLALLDQAAHYAQQLGLEVHAGHGLTFENVGSIARIAPIVELNIGHFLMGEALFTGMEAAILRMQCIIEDNRL